MTEEGLERKKITEQKINWQLWMGHDHYFLKHIKIDTR